MADRALARTGFHDRFVRRFHARPAFRAAAWPGPFFWSYVYDDVFWPTAYDEIFWTYGAPDILDGILQPAVYARHIDGAPRRSAGTGRVLARGSDLPSAARLCGEEPAGLMNLDGIEQEVRPTPDQAAAFDDLKFAEAKAVEILKAACPTDIPPTALDRLDAIAQRFDAMLNAVRMVKRPLETFYGLLSDEQKTRFAALLAVRGREGLSRWQASCIGPSRGATADPINARGFTGLSMDRIARELSVSDTQLAALDDLSLASDEAAKRLQGSCPRETPLTPIGRLAAIETRLDALLQAVNTLRPALDRFYGSLSPEQKARFDAVGAARRRAG